MIKNLFENKETVNLEKSLEAVKSEDYGCPNCGSTFLSYCDEYTVENEKFPKYFNYVNSHTYFGDFYYWDELHKCKTCKLLFYIESGN